MYTMEQFQSDVKSVIPFTVLRAMGDNGIQHLTDGGEDRVKTGLQFTRLCLFVAFHEINTINRAGMPMSASMEDVAHYLLNEAPSIDTPEIANRAHVIACVDSILNAARLSA